MTIRSNFQHASDVNSVHRIGHWLPKDPKMIIKWLNKLIKHVDNLPHQHLNNELRAFQEHVEADVTLKILASLMFTEVPAKTPYNTDPLLRPQVRDFQHLLQLLGHIIVSAPQWSSFADQVGFIGFPINAILEWPMNTYSGNAFFLRPDVNAHWTKILNKWAVFLTTAASAGVLTDQENGWLSEEALRQMCVVGNNGKSNYTFDQLYVCDQHAKYYGYQSWDDFFVRKFKPDKRTLPTNVDQLFTGTPQSGLPSGVSRDVLVSEALIYNACESTPVFLRRHKEVQESSEFWLKGQPYSLRDILANDTLTPTFAEGTVYQAYLSALSYHRWHSPVSGTIARAFNVPGTYYSANYFQGFANTDGGPDKIAATNSQAYLTQVAARAVIFIQADHQAIGLMCFVAVGMAEVSSNEITVIEGQHVNAGEQLGMFHYGGSTHCLLFRRGIELAFVLEPNMGSTYDPPPNHNLPLRSVIAAVIASKGLVKRRQ